MDRNINEIEFTIFDTETTGLDPESGDRIVEIAGIRFKEGKKLATFQALINPLRPISEAAFQVNKISEEMLKDAPLAEEVLPRFLEFIQGSCICSYNAGFDLGFLNNELRLIGKTPLQDIIVVDILKMAKRLIPGLERYALWFVAQKLGIKAEQSHRAFSDVEMTWDVFKKLKQILEAKEVYDFLNFSHLFSISSGLLDDINNKKIAEIQEAIDLGVKLKIKYLSSSSSKVSEREVIPKEIFQDKGRYYFRGHCLLRNEERSFRLDGILRLEVI